MWKKENAIQKQLPDRLHTNLIGAQKQMEENLTPDTNQSHNQIKEMFSQQKRTEIQKA